MEREPQGVPVGVPPRVRVRAGQFAGCVGKGDGEQEQVWDTVWRWSWQALLMDFAYGKGQVRGGETGSGGPCLIPGDIPVRRGHSISNVTPVLSKDT